VIAPHGHIPLGAIAAADTPLSTWAAGLLALIVIGIVAIIFGWLFARSLRLGYARRMAASGHSSGDADAWREAAKRIDPDDGLADGPDDTDPPPTGPHATWQT